MKNNVEINKIVVNTDELQKMFACGRSSAIKIGTEAQAKIKIGRRVFWNLDKIKNYIDNISE